MRALFWVTDCRLLTVFSNGRRSLHDLITFPRAPPPHTIPMGIIISTYGFGVNTNNQVIAPHILEEVSSSGARSLGNCDVSIFYTILIQVPVVNFKGK